MSEINEIRAETRIGSGTNKSKQVRKSGKLPAIIYGDGKDPLTISIDIYDLRKELSKSTFKNKLYDISIGNTKTRVLVQDINQNPITDQLEHIDFLRVNPKTRVTIEVPVSFINDTQSPGIKRGGVLNIVRHTIEVNCPVNKIPDTFEFNLADLEVGDSIHISHTNIDEEVETTIKDRDFTIASILAPSALLSETTEEESTDEEETTDEEKKDDTEKEEVKK